MKRAIFFCIALQSLYMACADAKPPLPYDREFTWPSVAAGRISDDGKFVMYEVRVDYAGDSLPREPTVSLVITALHRSWERHVASAIQQEFAADSKFAVLLRGDHKLLLVRLGTDRSEEIPNVTSFRISSDSAHNWIAYQLDDSSNTLVIRNLANKKRWKILAADAYVFGNAANVIVYETVERGASKASHALHWLRVSDGTDTVFWRGEHSEGYQFDRVDSQLVFLTSVSPDPKEALSLWHYSAGALSAEQWVDWSKAEVVNEIISPDGLSFSEDGNAIFWSARIRPPSKTGNDVSVDVWSYRDRELQSAQLHEIASGKLPELRRAILRENPRRIIQIDRNEEGPSFADQSNQVLMDNRAGVAQGECTWNTSADLKTYLFALRDGTRVRLDSDNGTCKGSFTMSPDGKYVLFSEASKGYSSYEINTGIWISISGGKLFPWTGPDNGRRSVQTAIASVDGWFKDKPSVLIWDGHDYWELDLTGHNPPSALTAGFGRRNNLQFKLLHPSGESWTSVPQPEPGGWRLLAAFSELEKSNGFYSLVDGNSKPQLLSMGKYGDFGLTFGETPIRAKNARIYLVKRESATESPNYYWTSDFISFNRISNVRPETNFNWLSCQLVRWKEHDGSLGQGVMYKPEDFDPNKKYPVIVEIYEVKTDELNSYIPPLPSGMELDIPHLVSNGYIVVLPDIQFTSEGPGVSAYNAVISAAEYLATLPWIDSRKLGIQGGSFGGFEVDYIIGHTNIFAAAYSRAGFVDLLSNYGSISAFGDGRGNMDWAENGQGRLGTPWENRERYTLNSPILSASSVITPLLMVHNREDGSVPFSQGEEFFTTLRRLGKKVWLLQYDGQGHHVEGPDAFDLSIRTKQFFDYYLAGHDPPKWMTQGVPATLKGIYNGLEIDASGAVP